MAMNYSHNIIEDFVKSQRVKTISYLQRNFSISNADCEDILQDSFMVLYRKAQEGKLDELTSSVSTYFISICRNKAMELLRRENKYFHFPTDNSESSGDHFFEDKVNNILSLEDDVDDIEQKEAIVRDIVKDLPSPCNELLWGFYRDGLSMKELAERYGYATENTVKVTKHRCCDIFKKRFTEMLNKLLQS